MNEDLLLASMDTAALFGVRRAVRVASWLAAGLAAFALLGSVGRLFA